MKALIFDLDGTLVYGENELFRAGAFRVFRDPADLHKYLDELGVMV
jgi:phosphoglycolate phosphatase-like HAD superfamily hydrolase